MKKFLTLMAVVLIGFTSCQKDSELQKPEENNSSGRTVVNLASIPPSISARILRPGGTEQCDRIGLFINGLGSNTWPYFSSFKTRSCPQLKDNQQWLLVQLLRLLTINLTNQIKLNKNNNIWLKLYSNSQSRRMS